MTAVFSWIIGGIAFAAMALLLYIAFCQVFLGHDGHTEKLFGRTSHKEIPSGFFPWLLPVVMGLVLLGLAFLQAHILWNDQVRLPSTGLFSLIPVADARFTGSVTIWLCVFSLCCYILGAVLARKLGGDRWCLLFCLNPWSVLFVLPGSYSLAVLLLILGYGGVQWKKYWITALCVAAFLTLHYPLTGFYIWEWAALFYTVLIPSLAKTKGRDFSLLAGGLAAFCGVVTVLIAGIAKG